MKKLPSDEELQRDTHRWTQVRGFDTPASVRPTDAGVLDYLRRANPELSFSQVGRRADAAVVPDKRMAPPLAEAIELEITVLVAGRQGAFTDLARTHGRELATEFRRMLGPDLVVNLSVRIPEPGAGAEPGRAALFKGYRGIRPGCLYAVNPDLSYRSTLVSAPKPGAQAQRVVTQTPGDIVLFCLEAEKDSRTDRR